jgi:hypothetical protein
MGVASEFRNTARKLPRHEIALTSEYPIRGSALNDRRNPENGVEYMLWGWKYGIRLYRIYRTTGMAMYKLTVTMTRGSPPEVSVMSPRRNEKMDRCKKVCRVWIIR